MADRTDTSKVSPLMRIMCLVAAASISLALSFAISAPEACAYEFDDCVAIMQEHVDWDGIRKAAGADGEEADEIEISLRQNATDENGDLIGALTGQGNDCILIPGKEYAFAPEVVVEPNSANCELFIAFDNELLDLMDQEEFRGQMESNGWELVDASREIYKYGQVLRTDSRQTVVKTFASLRIRGDAELEVGRVLACSYFAHAIGEKTAATVTSELPKTGDSNLALVLVALCALAASAFLIGKAMVGRRSRR